MLYGILFRDNTNLLMTLALKWYNNSLVFNYWIDL
jgi:hypothetical protein